MLIKATLSNARHPEYGEVTIPFPIKTSEYDRIMEMLANLEIGNIMGRDCKIMELSSPYSILQKLEGSEVNIDELDYLAKRLESFEADQDLQFQAAAFARGVTSILRHYSPSGEDVEEEHGSEPAANGGASPAPMEYGETHKSAVRL